MTNKRRSNVVLARSIPAFFVEDAQEILLTELLASFSFRLAAANPQKAARRGARALTVITRIAIENC